MGYIVSSYSYTNKKGILESAVKPSNLSNFATIVLLLELLRVISVLLSLLVLEVFLKLCRALLLFPHTAKVASQAVSSELHHNFGLAPIISFLNAYL